MASILIIEDDDSIREMLATLLQIENYEVSVAENGKVGFKLFRATPFDLVITDLFMPEQEGIETIKQIRGESRTVKIIAISGGSGNLTSTDVLHMAKLLGAHRALNKPFEMDKLLQTVRELLEQAE